MSPSIYHPGLSLSHVLFAFAVAPEIEVPSELYGVGPGTDITISCKVQAYPSPISYWMKDNDQMVIDG